MGDEAFQRKCFQKLAGYLDRRDRVLFLVSHNTRQIERVCSKVIWIEKGRVVREGESRELCNAYQARLHAQELRSRSYDRPRPDAADSGEVDVESLWLCTLNDEMPVTEIPADSALRAIIEFESHVPLVSPDIIVGFHTLDAVFIFAGNTGRLPRAPDFHAGRHRVACVFKEVRLIPGVYQVRLVFLDRHRRMMWGWPQALHFPGAPRTWFESDAYAAGVG